jgi:8-oxo-dGTP pyrophosphatase MutT (NUDIX family)
MKFREFVKDDYIGAGIVFVTPDKKILLLKKENGKWTFPGGHREPNEEPWQTAQRECFEELGMNPDGEILGKLKITKEENKKPVYSFFKAIDNEFTPTLSWEHKDYAWVDYKRLKPEKLTKVFQTYWGLYKKFLKDF